MPRPAQRTLKIRPSPLNFALTGKQRSRAQQASAQRKKRETLALAAAEKAWQAASVSRESWWVGKSREELERAAHDQARRMSASRYASMVGGAE